MIHRKTHAPNVYLIPPFNFDLNAKIFVGGDPQIHTYEKGLTYVSPIHMVGFAFQNFALTPVGV